MRYGPQGQFRRGFYVTEISIAVEPGLGLSRRERAQRELR